MTNGIYKRIKSLIVLFAGTVVVALLAPMVAVGAEAPVKLIVSNHVGWDVNKTKVKEAAPQAERNICTVASKDECQFGAPTSEAGGFRFPESVTVSNASALVSPEHGDVYVADTANQRVQVFSPAGTFVLMFGWNVNKTKEKESASSQAERNVCTAISKDVCQAGADGSAAGQLASPTSVTVDPATGNVYVEDFLNWRVQEFTANGEFVLMLGKEVNETKDSTPGATAAEKNLCTALSKDKCKAGERAAEDSTELGAFDFEQNRGGLLTVGGSEGLLYVGDRHRVQTFDTDGMPVAEISLASISVEQNSAVRALAVDQVGNIYVAYEVNFVDNVIYELNPSGKELEHFELSPKRPEATSVEVKIGAIALDPAGRLAVTEQETGFEAGHDFVALRGALYEIGATNLHLLTEFTNEFATENESLSARSIAFNGEGEMYAIGGDEVISYIPVPVAELSAEPSACKLGLDSETDATVECALKGDVNPENVPGTEVWFQWSKAPTLGFETKPQQVETSGESLEVSSVLAGLLPNETYYYRLVGEDEHVEAPEMLTSERTSVTTQVVAPRIVGEPSVPHVGPFSAVMFGELNPENVNTTYQFQYGPCDDLENCPDLSETAPSQSPTYGVIGTTVEASGLLPNTLYHYRLVAKSQGGEIKSEPAGIFTTAPGPAVTAQTGVASAVGTTSAIVSGTADPDSQAATYTFELGRYNGTATQFGIVFSGPTGSGAVPIEESLGLSGLQPGTTYAYRIAIHSGDGSAKNETATGATQTFTTDGLPAVFNPTSPGLLLVPKINFPKPSTKCRNGYKLTKQNKCVKAGKGTKTKTRKHHKKQNKKKK